jgi:hypothetical protein
MGKILNIFKKFEKNFNKRYAWFFTNGRKYQDNPNMFD